MLIKKIFCIIIVYLNHLSVSFMVYCIMSVIINSVLLLYVLLHHPSHWISYIYDTCVDPSAPHFLSVFTSTLLNSQPVRDTYSYPIHLHFIYLQSRGVWQWPHNCSFQRLITETSVSCHPVCLAPHFLWHLHCQMIQHPNPIRFVLVLVRLDLSIIFLFNQGALCWIAV